MLYTALLLVSTDSGDTSTTKLQATMTYRTAVYLKFSLIIVLLTAICLLVIYCRQNQLYQGKPYGSLITVFYQDHNKMEQRLLTDVPRSTANESAARNRPDISPNETPNAVLPASVMKSSNETFDCKTATLMDMSFPFCLYTANVDDTVSGLMLKGIYYESGLVSQCVQLLRRDRRLQLTDIGANLGLWSLPAARVSQVIAVEPNWNTMLRLAKAVHLGAVSFNITLLHNAISDVRASFVMGVHPTNQGNAFLINSTKCKATPNGQQCKTLPATKTILLNDLVPLMRSKTALLKVDTEGHEVNVFTESAAGQFFDQIEVPLIFMEWVLAKRQPVAKVQRLLNFFFSRNYTIFKSNSSTWHKSYLRWPDDILFQKIP